MNKRKTAGPPGLPEPVFKRKRVHTHDLNNRIIYGDQKYGRKN